MRSYSAQAIIEQVRIKYDEQSCGNNEMIVCPDDFDMETIIMSKISPAYRFVMLNADLSMLEGKQIEEEYKITIDDNLVGHLQLPKDFLRGITARLSSWDSSSSSIIEENSTEYRMQSDPYACGTYQQPVIAFVHTVKGKELEFYKAKSKEDELRSFVYVPLPPEDISIGAQELLIPDQLTEPFIYYVAALTATTFREDVANDFFKVARSLLGLE